MSYAYRFATKKQRIAAEEVIEPADQRLVLFVGASGSFSPRNNYLLEGEEAGDFDHFHNAFLRDNPVRFGPYVGAIVKQKHSLGIGFDWHQARMGFPLIRDEFGGDLNKLVNRRITADFGLRMNQMQAKNPFYFTLNYGFNWVRHTFETRWVQAFAFRSDEYLHRTTAQTLDLGFTYRVNADAAFLDIFARTPVFAYVAGRQKHIIESENREISLFRPFSRVENVEKISRGGLIDLGKRPIMEVGMRFSIRVKRWGNS